MDVILKLSSASAASNHQRSNCTTAVVGTIIGKMMWSFKREGKKRADSFAQETGVGSEHGGARGLPTRKSGRGGGKGTSLGAAGAGLG